MPKYLAWKDKCHAGSKTGQVCRLPKDHQGVHNCRDEVWEGNYDYSGVVIMEELNKIGGMFVVSPEKSVQLGNVFDSIVERLNYSCCDDCKGQDTDSDGPRVDFSDLD